VSSILTYGTIHLYVSAFGATCATDTIPSSVGTATDAKVGSAFYINAVPVGGGFRRLSKLSVASPREQV
jgi:hypothetical protein